MTDFTRELKNLIPMTILIKIVRIMPDILSREGTREADRLLEDHKGAEAEAKKLKAGMDSSVSCWYFGWGILYFGGYMVYMVALTRGPCLDILLNSLNSRQRS